MLPALPEIREVFHPAGTFISLHQHPEGQLTFVTRGTSTIMTSEGWWLASPGQAIWIIPQCPHSASYSESSQVIQLMLPQSLAGGLPGDCKTLNVSSLLRELLLEALAFRRPGRDNSDISLVWQLILHQVTHAPETLTLFIPQGQDRRLQQVTWHLKQDPGNEQTLPELAEQHGCSSRTLARLFRAETGMTFTRWRDHLRVITAVDRLSQGQPLHRVATELGYQSANSFSTMFSRLLGAPPGRYMRQMAAAESLPDYPSEI
ncbi:helix-turn-helix domain-containing protein [Tatumella citrea]|uniref:helix-turn-helix domain-containing protein n=1 Tax=Tatumella citrea TaxID=53336 RepID=UPI000B3C1789|nr:AraC family transcriptional regulator [Tatumella citrea]